MNDFKGIKILVMDRGHVKVAMMEPHPKLAFHWRLVATRIIRKWGTKNGLAELKDGPLPDTKCDTLHSSSVPYRAVLDIIDLSPKGEDAWKRELNLR